MTASPTPAGLSTGPYPEHFQHFIDDPNSVLREAIEDQDILGHIAIHLTTDTLSADGKPTEGIGSVYETVSNIPFLGVATRMLPPNVSPVPSPAPYAFEGGLTDKPAPPNPHRQRLRLFGKRNLLDRMGPQPRSAADTAA